MRTHVWSRLAVAFVLSSLVLASQAQTTPPAAEEEFKPVVGQSGKDVIWVPTPQALVETMMDLAKLTKDDILVDLGSGDGRMVISAAKRGATARGIEYNPKMVAYSQKAAKEAGVSDRATFVHGDIFETDFSDASVITMFLLPTLNEKLQPTILKMKPGTRVLSNSFSMADWQPDEKVDVTQDCTGYCTAMLWIVPASIEGTWSTPEGTMNIKQRYQFFDGELVGSSGSSKITEGRINGDQLTFKVGDNQYAARVDGDKMQGQVNGKTAWSASRK